MSHPVRAIQPPGSARGGVARVLQLRCHVTPRSLPTRSAVPRRPCFRGAVARPRASGGLPLVACALVMDAQPVAEPDGSGETNGVRGSVTEPAHVGDERTILLGLLQRQRDLVAWKVSAASDKRGAVVVPGILRR